MRYLNQMVKMANEINPSITHTLTPAELVMWNDIISNTGRVSTNSDKVTRASIRCKINRLIASTPVKHKGTYVKVRLGLETELLAAKKMIAKGYRELAVANLKIILKKAVQYEMHHIICECSEVLYRMHCTHYLSKEMLKRYAKRADLAKFIIDNESHIKLIYAELIKMRHEDRDLTDDALHHVEYYIKELAKVKHRSFVWKLFYKLIVATFYDSMRMYNDAIDACLEGLKILSNNKLQHSAGFQIFYLQLSLIQLSTYNYEGCLATLEKACDYGKLSQQNESEYRRMSILCYLGSLQYVKAKRHLKLWDTFGSKEKEDMKSLLTMYVNIIGNDPQEEAPRIKSYAISSNSMSIPMLIARSVNYCMLQSSSQPNVLTIEIGRPINHMLNNHLCDPHYEKIAIFLEMLLSTDILYEDLPLFINETKPLYLQMIAAEPTYAPELEIIPLEKLWKHLLLHLVKDESILDHYS